MDDGSHLAEHAAKDRIELITIGIIRKGLGIRPAEDHVCLSHAMIATSGTDALTEKMLVEDHFVSSTARSIQ
eukprot:6477062-Amphidinium_carterae.1